jgi:hypothetical protein
VAHRAARKSDSNNCRFERLTLLKPPALPGDIYCPPLALLLILARVAGGSESERRGEQPLVATTPSDNIPGGK